MSMPWVVPEHTGSIIAKYDAFIVPRSYMFRDKAIVPYEFEFAEFAQPLDEGDEFTKALLALLEQYDLLDVFGMRLLDAHDPNLPMKITGKKVNIMMRHGSIPDSEVIEAMWVFGLDEDDKCHCEGKCWRLPEGHRADHSGANIYWHIMKCRTEEVLSLFRMNFYSVIERRLLDTYAILLFPCLNIL
ncbi:hypothetical protein FQN54_002748 [Arachnomyces sp. PD_36]|nr:hypothetical protein FQN54_002748 [Arachnomyces sp. PD_36]